MTPVHISARALVKTAARKLGGADFVLACTDAGRAKWVQNLADEMGIPASFVLKRRMDGDKVELTAVSAHVDNRSVVIYDDMIRTGNSLITAGQAYREAGARKMSVVVTHGVFPGDALKKLQDSKLFDKIMCTDSHPRAVQLQGDFLEVTTVGTLLANAIKQQSYAVTADAGL
jgi:ribose-phosphate pyrophosphokinase